MLRYEKKLIEDGCKVIGEYVNTMTKVEIKCRCGRTFSKRPNDCLKSKRNQCPACRTGSSEDEIKKLVGEFDTEVGEQGRTYYIFPCTECGCKLRKYKSQLVGKSKQKNPTLCHKCSSKNLHKRNDIEKVSSFLADNNAKLVGDYNFEREVCDFIESLKVPFLRNDKKLISPLELDIVIPEKKLAIECNGVYFHSEGFETPEYHLNKTNRAFDAGYDLLHIFDLWWDSKKEKYKNIIRAKLGLNKKVFARKCNVVDVYKKEEKEFLNRFHLNGYIPSRQCLGLEYNGELLMVVSRGSPRFSKNCDHELLRMCSKGGTTVVGGFSKLMNCMPDGLWLSYVDRCLGAGHSYSKCGFKMVRTTLPSFYPFKGGKVYNRMKFQKHRLPKVLENYDEHLTAWENMVNNGYNRFYDCGNLVFERRKV